MKKTKKRQIALILGIIAIVAIIGLGFAACGGDDDTGGTGGTTHTHTYSTTWSSNAAQHWKECTGADCYAKTETANHALADGVCTTCGYVNMQMVSVSAGTFTMGPDFGETVSVTLSAFKIGKYVVTQEQYQAVMGENPSKFSSNPAAGEVQSKRPVEKVTWFDAIEFCNKLSTKEGLTPVYTITGRTPATGYPIQAATVTATWTNNGYRLPTEAQWEYACRAGSNTNWYFGDTEADLVNYAWYNANANSMTHEVGKKTANAWGLHDMHGNVWEWCWDWYDKLPASNQTDYKGAGLGFFRLSRGGCWNDSAQSTRSANRYGINPDETDGTVGFRVVLPDDGNTPPHTHTYSTTWSSNAAQHWKDCTGAGCDAKTETANHAPADGVCTTCGYVNMQMVSVSAGTFTMGSESGGDDNERPVRQVTLSPFKMGKYEVTQEQYLEVMGVNPSEFSSNPAAGEVQSKRPVEQVTWFDAIEFCNKLSVKEGLTPVYTITGRTPATGYPITGATVTATWENNGYRLPTEAQWEYACRAGSTTDWTVGNTELVNYAWYGENANSMTHQVGKKTANAWGLHDMHGNVWEWCWDWFSVYGESGNTNNPLGPVTGTYRVLRGGSGFDSASDTRSAYRAGNELSCVEGNIGFRVVRP